MHLPNENIAAVVVFSMTNEKVITTIRMTTGDQYFVYAVKTINSEYVIRMTDPKRKKNFISALYWQEKLIPLGVPLAKFLKTDLEGEYSPFPALLMTRLRGDDLCNVYKNLTPVDKINLANEMVKIQSLTNLLPEGKGYGIVSRYENNFEYKSWYDFLINRLYQFKDIISENGIFDISAVEHVISIAKNMENEFDSILAKPFLWDATERNVIINQGKISGIVDVDDMCFGDPLFVIALTAVALQLENHDTLYTDYWEKSLQLNGEEQIRLAFYKLFYAVVFMRKHTMMTTNNQKVVFNVDRLNAIFNNHLECFLSLNKTQNHVIDKQKIKFRALNLSDIPLLHVWFNTPHVQQFYSLRQWTEEEVLKKILPSATGKKPVYGFIVYINDIPIGYVQYYRLINFPWPDQSLSDDVVNQAAGMDFFIGDKNYLAKGYGKKLISAFLNEIIWPKFNFCVVDPDIKNKTSLECCEKLGFIKHKIIETENTLGFPVQLYLMIMPKGNC